MIFVSTYLKCKEFCWLILNEQMSKKKMPLTKKGSHKSILINNSSIGPVQL